MDAPDAIAGARRDLSVSEAIALLEQAGRAAAPANAETVALAEAAGRVLARDLAARADHPNVDDSAMDGYACRTGDVGTDAERAPVRLTVIGESAAGRPFQGSVGPGEAVRIHTGGAMPEGADGVVRVEAARVENHGVWLHEPARDHVRPRGQDVREGERALAAGRRLDAAAIGLAATMGHARVPVAPRPRVAVLVTGPELVPPGGSLGPGQVYDSNGPALSALLRAMGAEASVLEGVGEEREELRRALSAAVDAQPADLIVTSGGISMGAYDAVRDLLLEEGEPVFRRVRLKPGGPTSFGRWRGRPLLALPGNPVSALVTLLLFGSAFLQRWSGATAPLPYRRRLPARAGAPMRAARGKETLARVRLELREGALWASSTGSQSSGVARALAEADALAVLAADASLERGDPLEVVPLAPHLG